MANPESPYFLSIDIGSSSIRGGIYSYRGEPLSETLVAVKKNLALTDIEIDPTFILQQILRVLDDINEKIETSSLIVEFGVISCFWHSLMGVDSQGKPTTPLFTWAERRCSEEVEYLRSLFDEAEMRQATGSYFHSSYWMPKLLWLNANYRKKFANTDKWLSFSDFVANELFGECITSISMASGTGIFDIQKKHWHRALLEKLNIHESNLPRIAEDREAFSLTEKYQKRWSRLKNAKWFPAIGDGAANTLGVRATDTSRIALMIGTSGAMRVLYKGNPPKRIPDGLWCYRVDSKRVIVGGALSDGGGLIETLKQNLKLPKDDELEAELKARASYRHGINVLPFFGGERGTGYDEKAAGAIKGLSYSNDSVDLIQATMESIAFRFAKIYEALGEIFETKEIIASGGALENSHAWLQIISDVLGQKITLISQGEASSVGAVLLAAETIGKINDITEIEPAEGIDFFPDVGRHEIYIKARLRHEAFYEEQKKSL